MKRRILNVLIALDQFFYVLITFGSAAPVLVEAQDQFLTPAQTVAVEVPVLLG